MYTGTWMASNSSHTEPCFQNASRRWCAIHACAKGGVCSSRSSHISRHRSPTNAGSGGRALKASIVDAQGSMSEASRQPPM
jgi:hypothetical protein